MLSFNASLAHEHLLWIQRLHVWQSIKFTPTPLEHTLQGHLTFLVGFWSSPDGPSILVSPTFILRPRVSRDVLQVCNWIFKSSKLSLMMTTSSAYRSSQGQAIWHSREREREREEGRERESFSCIFWRIYIASVVLRPCIKSNCMSLMPTWDQIRLSRTRSKTFITCSGSLSLL